MHYRCERPQKRKYKNGSNGDAIFKKFVNLQLFFYFLHILLVSIVNTRELYSGFSGLADKSNWLGKRYTK